MSTVRWRKPSAMGIASHELAVHGVLSLVDRSCKALALPRHRRDIVALGHVVQQALAPAGDVEQVAIVALIPAPRHAEGLEGQIERDAMPVALGFRKRTVDVPKNGLRGVRHPVALG